MNAPSALPTPRSGTLSDAPSGPGPGVPPRPRVLLLAYACSPYHGSEPKVGWNRTVEAAHYCDVWVITEQREFEDDIRRFEAEHGPLPGVHWHFEPLTDREWANKTRPFINSGAFRAWNRRAADKARALHAEVGFDLVHHVNMVGFREPGYGWEFDDVPFVWGPIGGTQNFPWRFLHTITPRAAAAEMVRNVANRLQLWLSPRVRKAANRADVVLAANSTNQRHLAQLTRTTPQLLLETGVRAVGTPKRWADRRPGPVRVLWVGLCVRRKGTTLMRRAFEHLLDGPGAYELTVIGHGPDADSFDGLPHCDVKGFLPYAEALESYADADLFVFSSLRDTSGNVVLEAFANGLPVVALDHQGARDMVTADCGAKVPVSWPGQTARGIAEAVRSITATAERYDRLSAGAIERAKDYAWTRNGEIVNEIYTELTGKQGTFRRVLPDALRTSVGR
ncbi:MAG: glycosyltransferase family 4 protein [Bacteroidota bacterium]